MDSYVTGTSRNLEHEKDYINQDTLVIGKNDKSISVITDGELIALSPTIRRVKIDGNTGYEITEGQDNVKTIKQWGRVELTGNTETIVTYPIPFIDSVFNLQATCSYFASSVVDLRVDKVSNTQFKIKNVASGGETARIYWYAVGG